MARKGYNSDWQWKRWQYEVTAALTAIKAGRLQEAEAALDRADEINGQMELFWNEATNELVPERE